MVYHLDNPAITKERLWEIAEARLREAQALLHRGECSGAMFLGGCALECFLKVAICETLRLDGLPGVFKLHHLEALILYSGFRSELEAASSIEESFRAVVQEWKPDGRQSLLYGLPSRIAPARGRILQLPSESGCRNYTVVAKPTIDEAKETIEKALGEFFDKPGEERILVAFNSWGRLHALVASPDVNGKPRHQFRSQVWEFLKQRVPADALAYLYGIDILTRTEFEAAPVVSSEFLGGSSYFTKFDRLPPEALDG